MLRFITALMFIASSATAQEAISTMNANGEDLLLR
jgi:hypothetical protein